MENLRCFVGLAAARFLGGGDKGVVALVRAFRGNHVHLVRDPLPARRPEIVYRDALSNTKPRVDLKELGTRAGSEGWLVAELEGESMDSRAHDEQKGH